MCGIQNESKKVVQCYCAISAEVAKKFVNYKYVGNIFIYENEKQKKNTNIYW